MLFHIILITFRSNNNLRFSDAESIAEQWSNLLKETYCWLSGAESQFQNLGSFKYTTLFKEDQSSSEEN